jgi:hypothetical protein
VSTRAARRIGGPVSRLDSVIGRLEAQRRCLGHAAALVRDLAGPVLEIGLGDGRTYDHLRQLLPARRILAFDLRLAAHPASTPPADCLVLGDVLETLPRLVRERDLRAALAHADIGGPDRRASAALAAALAPWLAAAVVPGGVVLCDQPLAGSPGLAPLPPPEGVAPDRYFLYRAHGAP